MEVWVGIFAVAFGIPVIAILCEHFAKRWQVLERERARRLYERIVRDKLDVMKTAIAMGYSHDEIADLDARLQKLIGSDQLAALLKTKKPSAPEVLPDSELLDTDLDSEMRRVRERPQQG